MGSTSQSKAGRRKAPIKKPSTAKAAAKKGAAKAGAAGTAKRPTIKKPKRATKQPAADEIDDEVLEFIAALDDYKLRNDRPFPSWSEVLHVLKSLGYERT